MNPQDGWLHRVLLVALACLYLVVSLGNLDRVPPLHGDESWQASTAWKLATQGIFGSDMFGGFYRMDQRYYGFMPIHPLLEALIFRIAGPGLLQIRLISVAMGLLILLLTYLLGRRLFSPSIGLLAGALLLVARLHGLAPSRMSGILLLDTARLGRYDIVVPVFGLLALHTYWTAGPQPSTRRLLLAGMLAGLAGLSHLYGLFWLIALVALSRWERVAWRGVAALVLGCAIAWLPYIVYVLGDLQAWAGQMQPYGPRFELFRPGWYVDNLLNEWRRYSPGLGPPGRHYLWRPGLWTALLLTPGALIALLLRATRGGDRAARTLVLPALLLPALFALLISLKLANYAITVFPLMAVVAAWGGANLWNWRSRGRLFGRQWLRGALLILLAAVSLEGAARIRMLHVSSHTTTSYSAYTSRIRAYVPPGARVLGLHDYWLGLHDVDYRGWILPLWLSNPQYIDRPHSLGQALDGLQPEVILLDIHMREYFETAPARDPAPASIRAWMQQRGYALVATVEDETYGTMEIFRPQPDP